MKCKLGNTEINYEVIGAGKPILLFSGYMNDMTAMKNCMEPIFETKDGWKRIYVDHPGVGDTVVGEDIKSITDILDVIMEFVDKVVGEERFMLAGYSFGGFLSRYILNQKYKMVDGMLLINPVVLQDMTRWDVDREIEEIKHRDKEMQERVETRMATVMDAAMAKSDFEFLDTLRAKGSEVNIELDQFDEPFEKPTLILTGRQDTVVGYRDAFKLVDKYPRATYSIIDKAGHAVQIEQESLFNSLVEEWLYRVEESIEG